MKVKFCVPCSDLERLNKIIPFVEACYKTNNGRFEFIDQVCISSRVDLARNQLISLSRLQKQPDLGSVDRYIFLDSDISFEPEQIFKLLSYDDDIVVCPYELNNPETKEWCLAKFSDIYTGEIEHRYPDSKGYQEVDAGGTGVMSISKQVFETMDNPWFEFKYPVKDGVVHDIPEDFNFCIKARDLGFKVWCDFTNPFKHEKRELKVVA